MASAAKLVLLTGPKHSGKTTALLALADRARGAGHAVAGLAAPAVREGNAIIGYDALDLATGRRAPLLQAAGDRAPDVGRFVFVPRGREMAAAALKAAEGAALAAVDEFGLLERSGGGWRAAAEQLIVTSAGVVVLVVRRELLDAVAGLYAAAGPRVVPAGPEAVGTVLALL